MYFNITSIIALTIAITIANFSPWNPALCRGNISTHKASLNVLSSLDIAVKALHRLIYIYIQLHSTHHDMILRSVFCAQAITGWWGSRSVWNIN